MMLNAVLVVAGLALLFAGGEALVRGAVAAARRLGLSPLLVGLVVVGFGTSTPELLVSVQAALAGQPDIAVGNVVGSNIANILLIFGVSALILPIMVAPAIVRRDGVAMFLASAIFAAIALSGLISRPMGLVMLVTLIAYLGYCYYTESRGQAPSADLHRHEADAFDGHRLAGWLVVTLLVGGLVGVTLGARLLVLGAVEIARTLGVAEAVIGLTLVAVGTSLPELATGIVAALRNQSDVIVGNVLGSNLFNIFAILGVTAMITPVPVAEHMLNDVALMVGVSALALVFMITGWRIQRWEAALFLVGYISYVVLLFAM